MMVKHSGDFNEVSSTKTISPAKELEEYLGVTGLSGNYVLPGDVPVDLFKEHFWNVFETVEDTSSDVSEEGLQKMHPYFSGFISQEFEGVELEPSQFKELFAQALDIVWVEATEELQKIWKSLVVLNLELEDVNIDLDDMQCIYKSVMGVCNDLNADDINLTLGYEMTDAEFNKNIELKKDINKRLLSRAERHNQGSMCEVKWNASKGTLERIGHALFDEEYQLKNCPDFTVFN